MDEMDQQIERSLRLFRVLYRAFRSVSEHSTRDIKAHGLNQTEFAVLELLYHKGPIPLQQIGSRLLILSGGVTYTVDKLENAGYVSRRNCSEDRRVTYADVTEEGKRLMETIFPLHASVLNRAMSGLTEDEKDQAIELLKKLGMEADRLL
ncbi:MarR family transcriptional regulator [Paenibacillus sp.]|uniref:MarR family winged helix-turn-helix transcriptional regulator n=1 Tax=Paenibacillus sp. TaxID=58172 RepID=UPI002D6F21CF|nr:MarR family transcriptional regulator [Paenibacillus sp.]HZG55130.1 MarR family transcriptional regulator [Paenibacillus sp.]